jgi:hypothetical protein
MTKRNRDALNTFCIFSHQEKSVFDMSNVNSGVHFVCSYIFLVWTLHASLLLRQRLGSSVNAVRFDVMMSACQTPSKMSMMIYDDPRSQKET